MQGQTLKRHLPKSISRRHCTPAGGSCIHWLYHFFQHWCGNVGRAHERSGEKRVPSPDWINVPPFYGNGIHFQSWWILSAKWWISRIWAYWDVHLDMLGFMYTSSMLVLCILVASKHTLKRFCLETRQLFRTTKLNFRCDSLLFLWNRQHMSGLGAFMLSTSTLGPWSFSASLTVCTSSLTCSRALADECRTKHQEGSTPRWFGDCLADKGPFKWDSLA